MDLSRWVCDVMRFRLWHCMPDLTQYWVSFDQNGVSMTHAAMAIGHLVGGALDKWSSPHLHIMGEILRRDEMQNSNPESYQIRSRQRLISFPSGFRAEISNFLFLINVNSVIRRGFLQILRWFILREMNRVSNITDKNSIKIVCYCGVDRRFALAYMIWAKCWAVIEINITCFVVITHYYCTQTIMLSLNNGCLHHLCKC